jgi:hypothetical protein
MNEGFCDQWGLIIGWRLVLSAASLRGLRLPIFACRIGAKKVKKPSLRCAPLLLGDLCVYPARRKAAI